MLEQPGFPAQVAQLVEQGTENPLRFQLVTERFWSKVDRHSGPVHPVLGRCWQWKAGKNDRGYGRFRHEGRARKAHRVAYEALVGPVPGGMTIDHRCRNRACVNPDHLEPVTSRVNTLRGNGIAANNARKTHCPRGHLLKGDNLLPYGVRHGRRNCRTCHNQYRPPGRLWAESSRSGDREVRP